jgi:large subunit ribosomal protein L3
MGYHTRTEYNKWLLKLSAKPDEINPKGGFLHYGLVVNEYLLLKGSIPGPVRRPVVLTEPMRAPKKQEVIEIKYISQESKQ